MVLLIAPHPGFLIGRIVSLTIRAVIFSYTLLSLPLAFFLALFLQCMNLHSSFSPQLAFFTHFGSFFFMISETAGLGGLLRQLSDHQDLAVEEECQRRLRVQRVWPLSEAALGKGGTKKTSGQGMARTPRQPTHKSQKQSSNERRGDSVAASV